MNLFYRDWKSFPGNARKNLPFLGFTVLGFTILFFGITSVFYQTLFLGIGVIFISLGLFLLIFLSWPEPLIKTNEKLGHHMYLDGVNKLSPKIKKIGIIGLSSVGKTTLMENIIQTENSNQRTQQTSVIICRSRINKDQFFGIIDGPGNNTPEQFKIIENSDILIILFDHSLSDSMTSIDDDRLRDCSNLNNQFRNLFNQHSIKIEQIHLVLNKKDLWTEENVDKQEKLTDWFDEEISRWDTGSFAKFVTSSHHSNLVNSDLNELIRNLRI